MAPTLAGEGVAVESVAGKRELELQLEAAELSALASGDLPRTVSDYLPEARLPLTQAPIAFASFAPPTPTARLGWRSRLDR